MRNPAKITALAALALPFMLIVATLPAAEAATSYNSDGVSLTAPAVTVSSGRANYKFTLATNQAVTFSHVQLKNSNSTYPSYTKNVRLNGSRTWTVAQTLAPGTYTAAVQYQLGTRLVTGPGTTFTVPASTSASTSPSTATSSPTATNTATSVQSVNPSGLPFASGAYVDHNATRQTNFEIMRGRKLDMLAVFPARDSWASIHNPWWLNTAASDFKGTLNVAVPMWPSNGNITAASDGSYNAQWQQLGREISAKYPNAYVRIGWEMNLKNGWAATPTNETQWVKAFQLASTNLKVGGPNLRTVFNVNLGPGQTGFIDAAEVWPGDEYVDVVGVDAYDWWNPYTTDANWISHRDGAYGWNHWLNFAKAHHKPFSVPEWGLASGEAGSGGDNPKYFDYVYGWLKQNQADIAFENYFEEPGPFRSTLLDANPNGRAAYQQWMNTLAP